MNEFRIDSAQLDLEALERQARQMRADAMAAGVRTLGRWLREKISGRRTGEARGAA